jgi:hypothetical protein
VDIFIAKDDFPLEFLINFDQLQVIEIEAFGFFIKVL